MEYKMLFKPYDITPITSYMENHKGKHPLGAGEAYDWSATLNVYAKKGWAVKNSGTTMSGIYIVFWALLEKQSTSSRHNGLSKLVT